MVVTKPQGDATLMSCTFPSNRIQQLLHHGDYCGLGRPVLAEGAFIQLSARGHPTRQVYLAITATEFILVKQDPPPIQDESILTEPLSLDGLSVDVVFPLPLLRFFDLDDRAKRFVVCTCTETMLYFEMCQLDALTEVCWTNWRNKMFEFSDDNRNYYGYTIWRNKCLAGRKSWQHFNATGLVERNHSNSFSCFVRHPYAFHDVKSIECQTVTVDDDVKSVECQTVTVNDVCATKVKPGDKPFKRPSTARSGNTNMTQSKLKESVAIRKLDALDGGFRLARARTAKSRLRADNDFSNGHTPVRRSNSVPDIRYGMRATGDDSSLDTVVMAELSGCQYYGYQSGLPASTISVIKKESYYALVKRVLDIFRQGKFLMTIFANKLPRRRMKTSTFKFERPQDQEGSNSEEEMLDDLLVEISADTDSKAQGTGVSAKVLWRRAMAAALGKRNRRDPGMTPDHVVQQVVFNMCKPSHVTATRLMDFSPLEIATELTVISRSLLLDVRVRDLCTFQTSRGRQVCPSIKAILRFGEDVRKLVMSEILKCDTVTSRVTALKFYIQICLDLLLKLHDFQSFAAVYRGISSPPVYRLHVTWSSLRIDDPAYVSYMSCMGTVLSSAHGFAAYVNRCLNCMLKKREFIPWFEHLLAHCWIPSTDQLNFGYSSVCTGKTGTRASTKTNISHQKTVPEKRQKPKKNKIKSILTSSKKCKSTIKSFFFNRKKQLCVLFKSDDSIMRTQSLIRKQTDNENTESVSKIKGRRSSVFPMQFINDVDHGQKEYNVNLKQPSLESREKVPEKRQKTKKNKKIKSILTSSKKCKSTIKSLFCNRKKQIGVSFKSDDTIIRTQSLIRKQTNIENAESVSMIKGRRLSVFPMQFINDVDHVQKEYNVNSKQPSLESRENVTANIYPHVERHRKLLDAYCHRTASSIIRSAIDQLMHCGNMATAGDTYCMAGSSDSDSSTEDDSSSIDSIAPGIVRHQTSGTKQSNATKHAPISRPLADVPAIVEPSPDDVSTYSKSQNMTEMDIVGSTEQVERNTDSFGNPIPGSFYLKQIEAAQHIIRIPLHVGVKEKAKEQTMKEDATPKPKTAPRKMSTVAMKLANRRKSLFEQAIEKRDESKPENSDFDKSMKQELNRMKSTIIEFDDRLDQPVKEIVHNVDSDQGFFDNKMRSSNNVNHRDIKRNNSHQIPYIHKMKADNEQTKRSSIYPSANRSFYENPVDALHTAVKRNPRKMKPIHRLDYVLDEYKFLFNKNNNALRHWFRLPYRRATHEENNVSLCPPMALNAPAHMDRNRNSEISNNTWKRRPSHVMRSISDEQLSVNAFNANSSISCSLCAYSKCLYFLAIWKQLIHMQLNLVNWRVKSKEHVKSMLTDLILATEFLSEYDMFMLSRDIE